MPDTPAPSPLQQAVALHRAGRLAEAEPLYTAILRTAPDNTDALHFAGLLALQTARPQLAADLIGRAIRLGRRTARAHAGLAAAWRLLARPADALSAANEAIALDPAHADAHIQRALALPALGRTEDALASYDRALAINPQLAEAWSDRGVILARLNRAEDALASYDRALALRPDYARALSNRGAALADLGRLQAALDSHDRAVALDPDFAEGHSNRAVVLARLNRPHDALAAHDRALALRPDYADALTNRGGVLAGLRRLEEALASYDSVVALRPDDPLAHYNRGNVLADLLRPAEALESLDKAIALKADFATAYSHRGVVLADLRRPEEALAAHETAVALDPASAPIRSRRGVALAHLARHEEAIADHRRAIALDPGYAEAHSNLGNAFADLQRHEDALASYDRAIALDPDLPDPPWNKSHTLLRLGNFAEGLKLFEWRKRLAHRIAHHSYPRPLWLGEQDLAGKTLFIQREQGIGDTIQFARYASLAAARGARVIMSVQDSLKDLMASLDPRVEIIGTETTTIDFDLYCPMMSLPLAFATTADTIPAAPAYLAADKTRIAKWDAYLPKRTRPRIGIAWRGNPDFKRDNTRSMAFATIRPLLRANADFTCLLQDPGEAGAPPRNLTIPAAALRDFSDTAAVIALMDLVITTDTSLAHLAGALGKPVWILLQYTPDWRWLLNRPDSPWYPTARLFRQPAPGDWDHVITEVARALRKASKAREGFAPLDPPLRASP